MSSDSSSTDERDKSILEKIIIYCDEIEETKKVLGNSKEALTGSFIYRNTTAMSVLQIGELATHLSSTFKNLHAGVPWRQIIKMRNIAAHHYGDFRTDYLWETITNDIVPLKMYCEQCIAELSRESETRVIDDSAGSEQ
ncbi:MAG: DUF86 domain-containing protein [Coriobacteriales bacterium]|jgi:uncharacterized protein with HEPN domain|nr:DUF86 domain-containing protein [Coriobacteriales bacterium]